MAVKTDSPQIAALKIVVGKRFGHVIESRADFTRLCSEVERITHEHLAENTLRRIWGRLKGYDTVYTRTLDVLCRYSGYAHWYDFCIAFKKDAGIESETVKTSNAIHIEGLNAGDLIRIGWLPDRECIVRYEGGRIFRAMECKNSIIQVGDSFECNVFLKHYPLFVDNLVHGGELCSRYCMGLDNGLTTLEKI